MDHTVIHDQGAQQSQLLQSWLGRTSTTGRCRWASMVLEAPTTPCPLSSCSGSAALSSTHSFCATSSWAPAWGSRAGFRSSTCFFSTTSVVDLNCLSDRGLPQVGYCGIVWIQEKALVRLGLGVQKCFWEAFHLQVPRAFRNVILENVTTSLSNMYKEKLRQKTLLLETGVVVPPGGGRTAHKA